MSSHSTRARWSRTVWVPVIAASALLVAGCGTPDHSMAGATGPTTSAVERGATVVIDTFAFSPKVLHVKVGDTVTWTNGDNILHTVTSGTREYEPGDSGHVTATHKDGMFDMTLNSKGATATHMFTGAGTFHYFCDRHPGMEADIEVS